MPNITQIGNTTTYHFGFDAGNESLTLVGMAVESISIEYSPEFDAQGKQADGHTVADVTGPAMAEAKISGYIVDDATLAAALTFTFNSMVFSGLTIQRRGQNTEFKKGEVSGKYYAGAAS